MPCLLWIDNNVQHNAESDMPPFLFPLLPDLVFHSSEKNRETLFLLFIEIVFTVGRKYYSVPILLRFIPPPPRNGF